MWKWIKHLLWSCATVMPPSNVDELATDLWIGIPNFDELSDATMYLQSRVPDAVVCIKVIVGMGSCGEGQPTDGYYIIDAGIAQADRKAIAKGSTFSEAIGSVLEQWNAPVQRQGMARMSMN